jgi:hypothetical protein
MPPVAPQFQPHCCQLGHVPQELVSETENFTMYMNYHSTAIKVMKCIHLYWLQEI